MIRNFALIIFLFISIFNFAQDLAKLEVKYQMSFISDSTKMDRVLMVETTLLCNESKSIYFSRDAKIYYDYLYKKTTEMVSGKINLGTLPRYPKVRGNVYKDGAGVIATLPVGKFNYAFEEPELQWELLNETKIIDGVVCSSAKVVTDNGDTFFAWYTTQYQFQEGPFRFKKLPGLIIEVYNKNKTIVISAVEINKSNEIIEPMLIGDVIKLDSKEKFLKARGNYYKNPNVNTFGDDIIIIDEKGTDYTKRRKESVNSQNVFLD